MSKSMCAEFPSCLHYVSRIIMFAKIIMSAGRVWKFSSVAMCSLSQFLFYRHFQGLHREIKVYHVSLSGKSSQLRFAQLRFWLCGLFTIQARVWSELYKVWSATRRGSRFLCKNFRIFMVNILNGYTLIPLKFFSGRGCFFFSLHYCGYHKVRPKRFKPDGITAGKASEATGVLFEGILFFPGILPIR